MSRKTTNLDLTLSGPDDSGMDYQTYEYSQSGYTGSNMTKIDGAIGMPLNVLSTGAKTIVPAINEVQSGFESIFNRGYIDTKVSNDAFSILENGKFLIENGSNLPLGDKGSWEIDSTFKNNTAGYLQAKCIFSNNEEVKNTTWEIYLLGGTWQGWKQIATTKQENVLVTAYPEYTITENQSKIINNVLHFNIRFKKTDGTHFASNTQLQIGTLPFNVKEEASLSINGLSLAWVGYGSALASGNGIYMSIVTPDVNQVRITGTIIL
ncbi:MAG: hypothetical protein ACRCX8_14500 [Sarcina sp.]